MTAVPDSLTILKAHGGPVLAKRIGADRTIEDYDRAEWFEPFIVPVAGVADVHAALGVLLMKPYCAVVRGALAEPKGDHLIRRRVHPRDGIAATLKPCPRPWIAIDFDSINLPDGIEVRDLPACARAAVALLPPEFHGISCAFQATSGHGIKPGIRARGWFWLSRPVSDAEAKQWLDASPIDASLYSPAHLHYTSAPLFEGGRGDHLHERLVLLHGNPAVEVPTPEQLAPPQRPAMAPVPVGAVPSAYVAAALKNAYGRIANTEEGGRHAVLSREAAGLARFVVSGNLGEAQFRTLIHAAARAAGMSDEHEVGSILDWALSASQSDRRERAVA